MINRRNFIKAGTVAIGGITVAGTGAAFASTARNSYVSKRPAIGKRHFTSKAVEKTIAATKAKLKDPKLA